jgi:hypothetical protein
LPDFNAKDIEANPKYFLNTPHSPLIRNLLSSGDEFNDTLQGNSVFPPSIFNKEELRQGGVILYLIGLIYTFIAIVIVCNEFFVPSVFVVMDKIGCYEDVAGATILAAGREGLMH